MLMLLLLIPFWVGEIVRTYAIMILLGNTGAVNQALKWIGLIDRPIPFMYTSFSMGVGIVYLTALYMLLPLTIEGISSGCTLVFLISTGFYATLVLLGGPSTTIFAETIAGFFHVAGDQWPTGDTVALDNLTLDIARGEFVTFLGPSGCGKSTTLRILGGFERPSAGRVILDGVDVTLQAPEKRQVNMVFQDYALFPHMTVRQNISFGLELKGMNKRDIRARQDQIMAFLELDEFGDRYPAQLSGGQRQRVALARALAPDPALLLLDEPLGALDAKLRGQVQQELKAIQRSTHKTFFFVTHDQEEALTMSDRIVVMNKGRVEQDGTPEELYFHPATRFVAEFIGETNLLAGKMRGQSIGSDPVWIGWDKDSMAVLRD